MIDPQPSSLDRFVRERLIDLAGLWNEEPRLLVFRILTTVYGGVAGLMGLLALLIPAAPAKVALGGVGGAFVFAALTVHAIGVLIKMRLSQRRRPAVTVSAQARELARALLRQRRAWDLHYGYRGARARMVSWAPPTVPRAKEMLNPAAFALLDEAAGYYNRVEDLLAGDAEQLGPALERHRPELQSALDEAMAEILHQAAVLHLYPDTHPEAPARTRLDQLAELAQQVERLHQQHLAPGAPAASSGRMEALLDALRSETQAREELTLPAAPEESPQRLFGGQGGDRP